MTMTGRWQINNVAVSRRRPPAHVFSESAAIIIATMLSLPRVIGMHDFPSSPDDNASANIPRTPSCLCSGLKLGFSQGDMQMMMAELAFTWKGMWSQLVYSSFLSSCKNPTRGKFFAHFAPPAWFRFAWSLMMELAKLVTTMILLLWGLSFRPFAHAAQRCFHDGC